MAKETIREKGAEEKVEEPRKLNMEEKRKLEKLLLADIDSAVERYDRQAEEMRRSLIDKLAKHVPVKVRKLFESYKATQKQREQLETEIDKLGYDIAFDGELRVNASGNVATELAGFDAVARDMRQSLQSLKRNYVIKLFADHADTQSLFASLANDLKRLIG